MIKDFINKVFAETDQDQSERGRQYLKNRESAPHETWDADASSDRYQRMEALRTIIREEIQQSERRIIFALSQQIGQNRENRLNPETLVQIENRLAEISNRLERLQLSTPPAERWQQPAPDERWQQPDTSEPWQPGKMEMFEIQRTATYPRTRFARLVDSLTPPGFSEASLLDDKSCYEIYILSETLGTYRIRTDPEILGELLAMFDPVIKNGCEYGNIIPPRVNGIVTVEDGRLRWENGIWRITQKTKIKFI